jgi:hypothetical protein
VWRKADVAPTYVTHNYYGGGGYVPQAAAEYGQQQTAYQAESAKPYFPAYDPDAEGVFIERGAIGDAAHRIGRGAVFAYEHRKGLAVAGLVGTLALVVGVSAANSRPTPRPAAEYQVPKWLQGKKALPVEILENAVQNADTADGTPVPAQLAGNNNTVNIFDKGITNPDNGNAAKIPWPTLQKLPYAAMEVLTCGDKAPSKGTVGNALPVSTSDAKLLAGKDFNGHDPKQNLQVAEEDINRYVGAAWVDPANQAQYQKLAKHPQKEATQVVANGLSVYLLSIGVSGKDNKVAVTDIIALSSQADQPKSSYYDKLAADPHHQQLCASALTHTENGLSSGAYDDVSVPTVFEKQIDKLSGND